MSARDRAVEEQPSQPGSTPGDVTDSGPAESATSFGRHLNAPEATAVPGRTPVASPAAGPVGILIALVLIAVGVVGIRDALTAAGAFSGQLWTARAADTLDGLARADWMIPAGVVAILIGLWWLFAALKPRRRTGLQLGDSGLVWIRPRDVARVASTAAEDVDGITSAHSSASRRGVNVSVETTATTASEIERRVTETVAERLSAVDPSPKIKVNVRSVGGSQ
ncbi:MAG: DUF6286 domain-containing protein [Nocardioidaceae bacterium]